MNQSNYSDSDRESIRFIHDVCGVSFMTMEQETGIPDSTLHAIYAGKNSHLRSPVRRDVLRRYYETKKALLER